MQKTQFILHIEIESKNFAKSDYAVAMHFAGKLYGWNIMLYHLLHLQFITQQRISSIAEAFTVQNLKTFSINRITKWNENFSQNERQSHVHLLHCRSI